VGATQGVKKVVFKMRRRKASMRKTGHRQDYTAVHIDELVLPA
ncbi:MAG: bL21 family ribosomal protein, partial [bacterium]|nr:bL21 family ribosomal protein [bacterium]